MTNEIKQPSDEQIMIALAHLSMLAQAANGEFRALPGEIEERQVWLSSFIRTGQGIVNEDDRRLARQINNFLSTQSEMLSTQPDAA
jgi:chaperone required for assembly of F1-ATPase